MKFQRTLFAVALGVFTWTSRPDARAADLESQNLDCAVDGNQVKLSWNIHFFAPIRAWVIERDGQPIATLEPEANEFLDPDVPDGEHLYVLSAINLLDDKLFGMQVFSVQAPQTRGNLWEWLVLETARREDVLAPRSTFVNVVLNNNDVGVFYLEEHFRKELVESQGRRLSQQERAGLVGDVGHHLAGIEGSRCQLERHHCASASGCTCEHQGKSRRKAPQRPIDDVHTCRLHVLRHSASQAVLSALKIGRLRPVLDAS